MATPPTKGYDCEFTSEVPDEYKCPICKCVFRDPHRVSCCEEEYCKECIEQVLRDNKPCPNPKCGCNNDGISISEAKRTKGFTDKLRCHCSNRREGCEWEGELKELNNHLNENPTNENQLNGCDFTKIHCRWCRQFLLRNKIGEHQENVCQLRLFTCQHCDHQDTYQRVMAIHLPKCPRQPVECPQGCGLSPRRQSLAAHADKCPNKTIICKIPGCGESKQRKDMPAHNQEYAAQHVELLSQKVSELVEEADQRKKEQNARHLPVTVTMKNYEQLLTGRDWWMSRLLYTKDKGYAIFLQVYVGGYGFAGLTNNSSVYVYVTRGEYDEELQWPHRLSIEVSLINQDDDEDKVTKIFNIQAKKGDQNCYDGYQSFIKERNARRYVKDNCLKFMVTEHN